MSLTIACVTFDCTDAAVVADFWSALLERPVDPDASAGFASIGAGGQPPALYFVAVPDRTPGKNVIHLDLSAEDWTDQVDRAIGLGAKRVGDFDESGFQWTTLSDPEGNLFDIARGEH